MQMHWSKNQQCLVLGNLSANTALIETEHQVPSLWNAITHVA